MSKLREAEVRVEGLDSQVWSLGIGKSQAEDSVKVSEERALSAEARAVEAETRMLNWEARAAIAESKLAGTTKSANDRERETDTATALLVKEVEKRVAAESRAHVAEGTLGCLQVRVQTLAREVAMAEVLAQERISAAENLATQRMRDAEKRVGKAEQRAASCERSASSVIADYRQQTSLSPRKGGIPTRSLGFGGMMGPRKGGSAALPATLTRPGSVTTSTSCLSPRKGSVTLNQTSPRNRPAPVRRFSLGSPAAAATERRLTQVCTIEEVCSTMPPSCSGNQAGMLQEWSKGDLSVVGSEATTAFPSGSGSGSASGLSIGEEGEAVGSI